MIGTPYTVRYTVRALLFSRLLWKDAQVKHFKHSSTCFITRPDGACFIQIAQGPWPTDTALLKTFSILESKMCRHHIKIYNKEESVCRVRAKSHTRTHHWLCELNEKRPMKSFLFWFKKRREERIARATDYLKFMTLSSTMKNHGTKKDYSEKNMSCPTSLFLFLFHFFPSPIESHQTHQIIIV